MEEQKKTWIDKMIEREAVPKPLREGTVGDFAKEHGISDATYFYQRSKKENKKRIINIWLNEAMEDGNKVLEKLKEKALTGDNKAIELYMKFILELAENLDIKTDGESLNPMNKEDLTKLIQNYGINTKPDEVSSDENG